MPQALPEPWQSGTLLSTLGIGDLTGVLAVTRVEPALRPPLGDVHRPGRRLAMTAAPLRAITAAACVGDMGGTLPCGR